MYINKLQFGFGIYNNSLLGSILFVFYLFFSYVVSRSLYDTVKYESRNAGTIDCY